MQGLATIILIVLFFWLVWPAISRWLRRMAIRRAETHIRKKMGMPPPPPNQKKYQNRNQNQRQASGKKTAHSPIIPKEYAEDVEFVESVDFTQVSSEERKSSSSEEYHESQISDAEWTEVKSSGSK